MAHFARRFVRRSLRRLLRRFGYDLRPHPGGEDHWPHLAALLERSAVRCVFDVGANVGQYAAGLRSAGYGGRIVSFGPLAAAHAALLRKAAGDPLWEVATPMALGSERGRATLNVSSRCDMSSLPAPGPAARSLAARARPAGTETVAIETLADMLEERAGNEAGVFVKIDTEGYEDRVLTGLDGAWERVAGIQVELSLQPLWEGQPDHLAVLARLAEQGFRPRLIVPGFLDKAHGRMLAYDAVCFRAGVGE